MAASQSAREKATLPFCRADSNADDVDEDVMDGMVLGAVVRKGCRCCSSII